MAAYEFDELKKKYMQFQHPVAVIKVNGESLADAKKGYPVSDIRIDLTCGFEASVAEFCVYDVYDESTGSFEFPKKKTKLQLGCRVEVYLGYGGTATCVFVLCPTQSVCTHSSGLLICRRRSAVFFTSVSTNPVRAPRKTRSFCGSAMPRVGTLRALIKMAHPS